MTIQEKIDAIKSNISSLKTAQQKEQKEFQSRMAKLIRNLENDHDMPSSILRELRELNFNQS